MNNRQEQNTQKVKAILLLIFFWYSKYYLKTCVLKQTKKMRFRMFVIEKLFYIHCGEYGMRISGTFLCSAEIINAFGCFDVFNNNFPFFERTKCQNFQHKNAKQLEKMPTQFYSSSCLIFCHLNFEFEVFRICMRKKENCEWRANDREWWKQRPVSSQESDGAEWILWVIKTTTTTSTSFNVSVCHWEKMQTNMVSKMHSTQFHLRMSRKRKKKQRVIKLLIWYRKKAICVLCWKRAKHSKYRAHWLDMSLSCLNMHSFNIISLFFHRTRCHRRHHLRQHSPVNAIIRCNSSESCKTFVHRIHSSSHRAAIIAMYKLCTAANSIEIFQ